MPGVSQIDVKPEIDLTFAKGLRHILRQDPNVVMVGEIRDVETADIAIRAAMTGHLVFSTLHTNDAVGGITRLLDMDVEPFLLASVVKAFLAQRLVRTICPDCTETVEYPKEYLEEIRLSVRARKSPSSAAPAAKTAGKPAIRAARDLRNLRRDRTAQATDHAKARRRRVEASAPSRKACMTLRQDGWRRVAEGKTTIEEVVRVTQTDEVMAETTPEAEPVIAAVKPFRADCCHASSRAAQTVRDLTSAVSITQAIQCNPTRLQGRSRACARDDKYAAARYCCAR